MASIEVTTKAATSIEITERTLSVGGVVDLRNSDDSFTQSVTPDDSPVTIADTGISNSDDSYSVSQPATIEKELPDIDVSINGVDEFTHPAVKDVNIPIEQDGSPVGTWDGTKVVIPSTGDPVIPATITGGADIGYGEAITIGCSESGYDNYDWIFCARDFPDTHIDATGQNPSPILNWDGIWDVRLTVTQGSSVGHASTTVTVVDGLRYHDLSYIANTGGYTGTDKLVSNNASFYWGGTGNYVMLTDGQLSGDGGCIFQIGIAYLRMVAFTSVQDDPTTGFEYNNAATKWGLYWSFEDRMRLKDNASFPDVLTTDLKDMKWYKIQRVAGDFKFYEADRPDSNTWTELYDFAIDDTNDLYLVVYQHAASFRSFSHLYKFGTYV